AQGVLTAMASGDLTKQMTGAYQGEFEQMKMSLNTAITQLTQTVSLVREAVEAVTAGSEEISKGSDDLAHRTSEQAGALEETSASMEEMTSTVKQNADNSKQANQLAIAARDIANKGGAVTTRAVDAMGEINKSSKKIADIITVIDEIAFQTNLLALNAAVEAARAGEHGRGFAVVAAEVRNLAQRSATAAKEIKGLINESIQRVTDGTELVNQSGKTLEEIVGSVKRVTDIIAEISAASQEQASGIDQVNKAITQMDEGTQQNAALVEETASASQSMKEQANELLHKISVFKIHVSEAQKAGMPPVAKYRKHVAATIGKVYGKTEATLTSARKQEPKSHFQNEDIDRPQTGPDFRAAGVAVGNAKDRRSAGDDFEEF
ncbi:MAG TPA: methyl-accepting chemotaxis protein, partial [Nitrospira sp.]|nr:methyl-accepting chemotaxis protein [Nitrospira sp.]